MIPSNTTVVLKGMDGNLIIIEGFANGEWIQMPGKCFYKSTFEYTRKPFEFFVSREVDKPYFLNFVETLHGESFLIESNVHGSWFRVNRAFTEEECKQLSNFIDTM